MGTMTSDLATNLITAAVAVDAIFRPDDAADRHDQHDADDHFKGVHGE